MAEQRARVILGVRCDNEESGRWHVIMLGLQETILKFSELVRLLEAHGFMLVKEKGSIRYYGKAGYPALIRVDYYGAKEVPSGTCHHILKSAGIKKGESHD